MSKVAVLFNTTAPPKNAETIAYRARIIAAGGSISAAATNIVDTFVSEGKLNGWWDKIIDASMCVGSNLAGALCKIVVAPSTSTSYSNNGFVEGDYSQGGGLGDLSNTSKYLGTGVTPSDLSMDILEMAIAVESLTDGFTGIVLGGSILDPYISDNPASGDPNIHINSTRIGLKAGQSNADYGQNGATVRLVSHSPIRARLDGFPTLTHGTDADLTAVTPTTEMTIFRQKVSGNFGFGRVKAGATFIFNQALSETEQKQFSLALIRFSRGIRSQAFSTRHLFLGDSITMGIQVTEAESWASLVAAALGVQRVNTGISAEPLNFLGGYFAPHIVQLINKYQEGPDLDVGRVYIMIGTNDAAFLGNTPPANFQSALETICSFYVSRNIPTVLMSLPWTGTGGVGRDFTLYAAATAAAAAAVPGVTFVDIFQAFIDTGDPESYFVEAPPNSFHPNAAGHTLMANAVLAV